MKLLTDKDLISPPPRNIFSRNSYKLLHFEAALPFKFSFIKYPLGTLGTTILLKVLLPKLGFIPFGPSIQIQLK